MQLQLRLGIPKHLFQFNQYTFAVLLLVSMNIILPDRLWIYLTFVAAPY